MASQTAHLPTAVAGHVNETLTTLAGALKQLNSGISGSLRKTVEQTLHRGLIELQSELRGDEVLPEGYCGSCYGASPDPKRCCNTCALPPTSHHAGGRQAVPLVAACAMAPLAPLPPLRAPSPNGLDRLLNRLGGRCSELKEVYAARRWGFPDPSNFEQCKREARSRSSKLQEGEGCNIYGTMEVARVTGSFHIAPQTKLPSAKLQKLSGAQVSAFNVTHKINRLSFGTDFPGQHNPLDQVWQHSPSGAAVSRYFLKVVPTTYEFLGGRAVHTNQFSVTQYFRPLTAESGASMVPTVSFTFELTPLKVLKTERRAGSFFGFLTRCAALIGGLFTVASILDGALYFSTRHLEKLQLNKQG